MLGDCTMADGADFSPRSSIEHDVAGWFVVPRSTPSVTEAVVCGADRPTATPLSASGSSGDGFWVLASTTPSTDGGDMAADMTRGVGRVKTGRCGLLVVDDLPSATAVSCTDTAYNTAGKRYRATAG